MSSDDYIARVECNLDHDRPRRKVERRCGPTQEATPDQVGDAGRHGSRLLSVRRDDKQGIEEVEKESGDWKADIDSQGLRQQSPVAAHAELQREVID